MLIKKKIRKVLELFFALFLISVLFVAGLFVYFSIGLPSLDNSQAISLAQSTKIYDRTGKHLLYEIHGEEKRTIVEDKKIPLFLKQATIAIEDKDFYKHPAFDWQAILRAVFVDLIHGKIVEGGSTITQQLVKNTFLTPKRTIRRKIRELILAYQLEKKYSKNKILWYYLNTISYGSNIYGVEEASRTYFGKDVSQINLAEAALLASLPQAPSYYSPYGNHFDELLKRKNLVLKEMLEDGYINKSQYQEAKNQKIKILPRKESILAPHFVMYVKELLAKKYGEDFLEKGGLKVYTTLDWKTQQIAQESIKWGVKRNRKLASANNAGMVVQDAKTGQVLAMVGSYDYFDVKNQGNFNVCLAKRQPGSSFKPFIYLESFLKGYRPETVVFDLKTNFDTTGEPGREYIPRNFDHRYRGPVTLRAALAQSINVPAVKMLYLAGIKDSIKLAKKLGITTLNHPDRYGLSLVLGGGEVRLLDMVEAYSVFAQNGIKHPQVFILKVLDNKGNVLEQYKPAEEQVVDPQKVKLLDSVLDDNKARAPLYGTHNQIQVPGWQIAAKTGTTNNARDAWIFAYTPTYVTGIWAGNNNNTPMEQNGSSIMFVVPIWHHFAQQFLKDKTPEKFEKPDPEKPINKPMINGNYIVPYIENGQLKPQIHSILWYVDKDNPLGPPPVNPSKDLQFKNWESSVLAWLKTVNLNMDYFNQPINYQTKLNPMVLSSSSIEKKEIKIISPLNGDFVDNNFQLEINLNSKISLLEVYLNNDLVKSVANLSEGTSTIPIQVNDLKIQNKLFVKAIFSDKKSIQKEIIIYKKIN